MKKPADWDDMPALRPAGFYERFIRKLPLGCKGCLLLVAATGNPVSHGRSDEQRRAGTDDNTEDHREDETADRLTAEEQHDEQHEQGRDRGHQGS